MTSIARPTSSVRKTTLNNGIAVIAVENPTADIMAARIFFGAGSRREKPDRAGVAHLLATVMTKGTETRSSMEIAEQVESMGASLGTDTAADYFVLGLKTVSEDFAQILALAAEILQRPTFPESEVKLEQRLTLQAIRSQKEQPMSIAFAQLRQSMYAEHPYARSSLGTEASVSELTRDDLLDYHQTYFRPDNMAIGVSGCLNSSEAIAQIEKVFGDWQAPEIPLPPEELPSIASQPGCQITTQETQQSIVMLGYLGPSVSMGEFFDGVSTDYASLKLLDTYLGNGLSSRLFVELREKRGLAYDVSAFFPTRLDRSNFVTYMGTAPSNTQIALEGLRAEVERLRVTPLTPEELQASKNKLLGQYALGKQTNAQLAQIYGWYEMMGLGVEFDDRFPEAIAALTSQIALETAQRYFLEPYISLVGPEKFVSAIA
ncbi:insulinase family protein [Oscillatoriales cyanobacterium LEGE 11467]|uniref:Insulinase family protein n=1 Tax=Zarconia navalis LEGE 11467 TaxID=1828826 RepID=A0A928VXG2_9CYAN|nr:pitrilysin family protein [Zarconia navalis]MBE9041073.1 insulinase family protein [Zarconia navalis LEGE 11467]